MPPGRMYGYPTEKIIKKYGKSVNSICKKIKLSCPTITDKIIDRNT